MKVQFKRIHIIVVLTMASIFSMRICSSVTITKANYHTVVSTNKPLVIDVYAPWCPPCRKMLPIFEQIAAELEASYSFAKLNIDEAGFLIKEYQVTSVPTLLFFNNKKLLGKESGYKTKDQLKALINHYFELLTTEAA